MSKRFQEAAKQVSADKPTLHEIGRAMALNKLYGFCEYDPQDELGLTDAQYAKACDAATKFIDRAIRAIQPRKRSQPGGGR